MSKNAGVAGYVKAFWHVLSESQTGQCINYLLFAVLVIYGAQGIALGAYDAIRILFPQREIICFLVTEMGINASELRGIPVCPLAAFASKFSPREKENIEVMICTPEDVMDEIELSLHDAGLHHHVRMDSLRWAELMQMAYAKVGKFMPLRAYPIGNQQPDIHVYKAMFHRDRLLNNVYENPNYMVGLQVGAVQTKMRIADLSDNVGNNISEKNGNYSELTGLYWIWKNRVLADENRDQAYYGLAHYRRWLQLTEDDLLRLRDNDIDVVLPYPMPYEPDIEVHHLRYLADSERKAILQALEELQPEYAKTLDGILRQPYLYNYNLIIAKGNVLANYCNWLFPILFRVEQINDPSGEKPANRFIGYVGETLETLYFTYNKQNLKIAHAGCRFLL